MNVLVIGSGGREHALCWALSSAPSVERLYCAPGNGGISRHAECVDLDPFDFAAIIDYCRRQDIALVVVGPEQPLVAGIADTLVAAGVRVFGPDEKAAVLEGSKVFTKNLCAKYEIPTAQYRTFDDADQAVAYIRERGVPIVVKADGLAAGKGAIVCDTLADAEEAARSVLGGQFGAAGAEIVVEDFMAGEEASFFALCDGRTVLPLATAQDHKRVGDGDTGPNTGGMGAYSPAPVMTREMCELTMERIIEPTVRAMAAEGRPFKGVLYAGLMITDEGPKLIEYNIRFGDPECQVLMARLTSDLGEALTACADGRLDEIDLEWSDDVAMVVVMAANGYPGDYAKGSEIRALDAASAVPGVTVLHAGTRSENDRILASGGRVLGVTALAATVTEAQARAYQAVDVIDWPGGFCRRDIGWRAVEREQAGGVGGEVKS
jgi:phosphoribosylamine--glycine ligase